METEIILPIVHLNGTGKTALIDQLSAVAYALGDAIAKLCDAAPHGRDYYPVPGLLARAQAQHERRLETLRSLYDEITAEAVALYELP